MEEAEILQELELAALREDEANLLCSPASSRHSRSSRSRKSSGSAALRFGGSADSKRGEVLHAISGATGMGAVSALPKATQLTVTPELRRFMSSQNSIQSSVRLTRISFQCS